MAVTIILSITAILITVAVCFAYIMVRIAENDSERASAAARDARMRARRNKCPLISLKRLKTHDMEKKKLTTDETRVLMGETRGYQQGVEEILLSTYKITE